MNDDPILDPAILAEQGEEENASSDEARQDKLAQLRQRYSDLRRAITQVCREITELEPTPSTMPFPGVQMRGAFVRAQGKQGTAGLEHHIYTLREEVNEQGADTELSPYKWLMPASGFGFVPDSTMGVSQVQQIGAPLTTPAAHASSWAEAVRLLGQLDSRVENLQAGMDAMNQTRTDAVIASPEGTARTSSGVAAPLGATLKLTAWLQAEELSDGEMVYVSLCPELDVASQGNTTEEAVANLKEAIEGLIEAGGLAEIERRLREMRGSMQPIEVPLEGLGVPVG